MKKFVIDTSVLIDNPQLIRTFKEGEIIILSSVIEELDKIKSGYGDSAKASRIVIRELDKISNNGIESEIREGVRIRFEQIEKRYEYGDDSIIDYIRDNREIILLSNDINLRVRGKILGVRSEEYYSEKIDQEYFYGGIRSIEDKEAGEELKANEVISNAKYNLELKQNEFVKLTEGEEVISIGRRVGNDIKVLKVEMPMDLVPKNIEQSCAINLLMDKKIPLVTLAGKAGSGKSLVAIASCLEQVLVRKTYNKLIIYKPMEPVGREVGFMPGDLEEKLFHWMGSVHDTFEFLFGDKWKNMIQMYIKNNKIEIDALTFIRGRSIGKSIILVEESQNLTKEEVKTLLTRVGEGTKIILDGDLEQIDHKGLDILSNGLIYCIDKFKGSKLAGHVTFIEGVRSKLATEASMIL